MNTAVTAAQQAQETEPRSYPSVRRFESWLQSRYCKADLQVLLVNAHDVKSVQGRKTDVSDAAWLADLGANGLLRHRSYHRNRSGNCGT